MGYDVNYPKNIEMQLNLDSFLSECSNALDVIETISTRISGTGALKCEAKTALSAYINDVILGVMIPVTRMAMSYLSTEVSCYVFEMYDYDNDEHAIIQEDFLNALNEKLNSLGTDVLDILDCCKTVAGNVSDIMALESTFVVKTNEIVGLSAEEIAEKLALPKVPNKVVKVELPPSTPLEVSIVGPQSDWGTIGGDIQFAIKDVDLNPKWFTNIKDLE